MAKYSKLGDFHPVVSKMTLNIFLLTIIHEEKYIKKNKHQLKGRGHQIIQKYNTPLSAGYSRPTDKVILMVKDGVLSP